MARRVSLYEAKTHLSRLVDEAANGETIVIAKAGKPMARLVPLSGGRKLPRRLGQLARSSRAVDWEKWWQEWKASDRTIEAGFEAAVGRPLPSTRHPRRQVR